MCTGLNQLIKTKFLFQKLSTQQIKITCDQKDWIYFPINNILNSGSELCNKVINTVLWFGWMITRGYKIAVTMAAYLSPNNFKVITAIVKTRL